jgi:hypothetical protein
MAELWFQENVCQISKLRYLICLAHCRKLQICTNQTWNRRGGVLIIQTICFLTSVLRFPPKERSLLLRFWTTEFLIPIPGQSMLDENFESTIGRACMWSIQSNVEIGYQLSIRSGTKENHGSPCYIKESYISTWQQEDPKRCNRKLSRKYCGGAYTEWNYNTKGSDNFLHGSNQQPECLPSFTRGRKQIQFPKRCVL